MRMPKRPTLKTKPTCGHAKQGRQQAADDGMHRKITEVPRMGTRPAKGRE